MNNLYKYITIAFLAVISASCSKSFLEKEPIGKVGKAVMFEDVAGARTALNGAYNRVSYYYAREFTLYGDVAGDDVVVKQSGSVSGQLTMFDEYNFQSTRDGEATAVGHIWLNILEATNNINNIINALPDLAIAFPKSKGELDSIMGQALILRALCHFDLSKVYAQQYNFTPDASHLGVPVLLKTPAPGELISRKTIKETYEQIINDLKAGTDLLKNHPYRNRFAVSYHAGLALLARVYLYMGDWENAYSYADQVIKSGKFSLVDGTLYADLFQKDSENGEMIFKLFNRKDLTSSSTSAPGTIASFYSDTSLFQAVPSAALMSSLDATDVRRNVVFASKGNCTKYGINKSAGEWIIDPKVVRFAELYLIRAEALWQKGQYDAAAGDIKTIAQRAHPGTTITITYATPAELYKIIAAERRRELFFEGFRLYDLARRKESIVRGADCLASKCSLTYPNARYVLPIPGKELDANKAMQPNPEIN